MIVSSEFIDYYDNIGASAGVDRQCVYNRVTRAHGKESLPFPLDLWERQNSVWMNRWFNHVLGFKSNTCLPKTNTFALFFCGKVYTGWVYDGLNGRVTAWSSDELDAAKKGLDLERERVPGVNTGDMFALLDIFEKNRVSLRDWLDIEAVECHHVNRQLCSPVVAVKVSNECGRRDETRVAPNINEGDHNVIVDPCLQDIGFQRVVDPWTCWQTIHQYNSGVLGKSETETVEISDQHMRDAKGFDEWSFKNRGTAKRRKRKKKQ